MAALQDQEDLEDNLQLQTLRQRTQKALSLTSANSVLILLSEQERLEIQLGDVNSKLEQIDRFAHQSVLSELS